MDYHHYLTLEGEGSHQTFMQTDHFGGETQYFSECIRNGTWPEPDGREGLADVRVIAAIETASKPVCRNCWSRMIAASRLIRPMRAISARWTCRRWWMPPRRKVDMAARMNAHTAQVATALKAALKPPPLPPVAATADVDAAKASARLAGLRYVSDDKPGISRALRRGKTVYEYKGERVTDLTTLARIKALVIPPAWTDVWICPYANGHLQATGRDAKGRKQYRYHTRWREVRDESKYHRMLAFGHALPQIRERAAQDLAQRGMPRTKVLAAVVLLLESTLIRVGNDEYAKANKSYGLTTMRNRHVDISGNTVRFHFRGKSGKQHDIELSDRRLARIVQKCRELPGQELFQYLDEDGARHGVDSSDVNEYLKDIAGEDYTAKDFRTWAGTVLAAGELARNWPYESDADAKRHITATVQVVSQRLGNTPAVCRKCYIHGDYRGLSAGQRA